jgi:hypothetical protein
MLSFVALLLFGASAIVYWRTLSAGVYRRIPIEHYVLMGASVVLGTLALLREPSWWAVAIFLIVFVSLLFMAWYVHFGSIFRRGPINLKVGERFPEFTLSDSRGQIFSSRQTAGKQSVLYLFYRGDW